MKFFTKSNLISIATLALVCISSAAVSAANFNSSHTAYSTLKMVNPQTARSSNETDVAQRVKSNHDGDSQKNLTTLKQFLAVLFVVLSVTLCIVSLIGFLANGKHSIALLRLSMAIVHSFTDTSEFC